MVPRIIVAREILNFSVNAACYCEEIRRENRCFDLRQLQATEDFYTLAMISIEAKLNCERHIADLKLCIAQLKAGSRLGSDVSAEFIDLLQHNLDSWEERKKTLADHH
jgi:hypothetical protein